MLPRIAIPDTDDARTVFDALNAFYVYHSDTMTTDTKIRVIDLLMASHAEINRETES